MTTFEALEADVQRALDRVILAVTRAVPSGSDVINPSGLVKQWIAQLSPEARAHFMLTILSHGSEAHMNDIARAVILGEDTWYRAGVGVVDLQPTAAVTDLVPEPD